ncbi:hypothetical protein NECAME_11315 [Necator americanus]|uniref:Uncharacterized protein n=1 Tax=Necator americanus TaxID=51031 RepID=W2T569_NECAM|nr:hypothetical protein NECAME_11315 [Necator americanus]ETN77058.1 hypothetical protein NECAME_11315 [Necator americanus]
MCEAINRIFMEDKRLDGVEISELVYERGSEGTSICNYELKKSVRDHRFDSIKKVKAKSKKALNPPYGNGE